MSSYAEFSIFMLHLSIRKRYKRVLSSIVTIQKNYRAHFWRRAFLRLRLAAIILQKYQRGRLGRVLCLQLTEKRKREEEERRREEEEERRRVEEEERRRMEEEKRQRQEEEEKQRVLDEEVKRREEEEGLKRNEEQRLLEEREEEEKMAAKADEKR